MAIMVTSTHLSVRIRLDVLVRPVELTASAKAVNSVA